MIDFAHEEVLFFLALLAFGNVLSGAAEAHSMALRPGARKISKPMPLYPANRTVPAPNPVLMGERLRIDGIERRLAVRPKPFRVVRMHPLHDLFDRCLVGGKIENFLCPRIHRDYVAERIVLPPSELGCVESELQAIFARLQVPLRRLSPGGRPSKLRHQGVDLGDRSSARRQWTAFSQCSSGASCVTDRTCDEPA